MKTINELFEEIKTSDALKNELAEAFQKKDKAALEAFLKNNGCDASIEEAKQYLREKGAEVQNNGELTAEELEQVSGGSELMAGLISGLTVFLTAEAIGAAIYAGNEIAESC